MQILLRARLLDPISDPELEACRSKFFPASGPLLDRLLTACQENGEQVSFLRDVRWSPQEMQEAPAFLVSRGQFIAQPQTLYARQQEQARRLTTESRWGSIRGYRRIFLSTAPRPGAFRFLDQWSNELVTAVEDWEFRGARLQPALTARGEERQDAQHIQIEQIVEPVIWDSTLLETWDDGPRSPSTPRRRGTLTYRAEVFRQGWDLARTAEPFGCQGTGEVLVSRRFYDCYHVRNWKGLRFWPVWAENSPQAHEHVQGWAEVLRQLERVPTAQLWF